MRKTPKKHTFLTWQHTSSINTPAQRAVEGFSARFGPKICCVIRIICCVIRTEIICCIIRTENLLRYPPQNSPSDPSVLPIAGGVDDSVPRYSTRSFEVRCVVKFRQTLRQVCGGDRRVGRRGSYSHGRGTPKPCTLHTLYTLHSTLYILHSTLYALHSLHS